jgi:stringent starvation protein B
MIRDTETPSTRPYLIRALHEWCSDNGLTPYVTVAVDASVQVPREFVKDGEIVLNVGFDATTELKLGNEFLAFKARFGGVARDIFVPIDQVIAIFAKENGQGMAFPLIKKSDDVIAESVMPEKAVPARLSSVQVTQPPGTSNVATETPKPGTRPSLTRVK